MGKTLPAAVPATVAGEKPIVRFGGSSFETADDYFALTRGKVMFHYLIV